MIYIRMIAGFFQGCLPEFGRTLRKSRWVDELSRRAGLSETDLVQTTPPLRGRTVTPVATPSPAEGSTAKLKNSSGWVFRRHNDGHVYGCGSGGPVVTTEHEQNRLVTKDLTCHMRA